MIRNILAVFLILFISCQVLAQEKFYSLEYNATVAKQYKNMLNDKPGGLYTDTLYLSLPFFDDFSSLSVWPSPLRWADNYAFINTDYAINSPTIGVATLDAIDEKGALYSNAGPYPFEADQLTSQAIRLDSLFSPQKRAITLRDSLYLSFYYQPQGRGGMPSKRDSLILEFHCPLEVDTVLITGGISLVPRWHAVWATPGGIPVDTFALQQHKYFRQVMVPVRDSALYYKKGFRFRFRNIASLASANQPDWQSNGDQWNIDAVMLNTGRSIHDTLLKDVAFADRAPSMLRRYESMPYKQYKANWLEEMKDTMSIKIANLDNVPQNIGYKYNARKDSQAPFKSYDGGSYSVFPFGTIGYSDYQPFARPVVNFFYSPFENEEKIAFHTTHYLTTDPSLLYQGNDTISYTQIFSNYYAYDDGTAEAGIGLNGASGAYAVRFQLNQEDTLRGLQIYFNQVRSGTNLQYIDLAIWNDLNGQPGSIVRKINQVTPQYSDSLNVFHTYWLDSVSSINELSFPGLIFYAGWQQTGIDNMNIGFDRYNDTHTSRFFNVDGTWQMSDSQHAGSLMLRPVIGLANPLGIRKQPATLSLKLYPNPVTGGLIHLSLPEVWKQSQSEHISVSILDAGGKLLEEPAFNTTIAIGNLSPGLYLLKLYNRETGETATGKFIVQ